MLKFKYKIREYNENERYIVVDYDDNTWARINFMNSIPTNQAELNKLVSQFTKHVEQFEARKADDSFIKGTVGIEHEAERFSFLNPNYSQSEPSVNPYADSLNDMDEELIEEIVTKILIAKGVINE